MTFGGVAPKFALESKLQTLNQNYEYFVDGLIDTMPHFNSVNRYIANPELPPVLTGLVTASSLPLKAVETDFAVDSSGFSTCRYVRWFNV